MISETSLIPRPTPSSFPPVSLALFLIAFLSLAHSYALLAANPFSFSLSLLFLCSCHRHVFFSSSDLSILPILLPSSNPAFPQFLFSPFLSCCFSVTLTFSLSPLLWPFTVSHLLNMHFHLMFSLRYVNHFISHHHWLLSNAGKGNDGL